MSPFDDRSTPPHEEEEGVDYPSPSPFSIVPIPSVGVLKPTLTPPDQVVVRTDDRSMMRLIELLLDRSGVSQADLAQRLGITRQSINQYRWLRRKRPSVQWLARLAKACGGRLVVEFPRKEGEAQ